MGGWHRIGEEPWVCRGYRLGRRGKVRGVAAHLELLPSGILEWQQNCVGTIERVATDCLLPGVAGYKN